MKIKNLNIVGWLLFAAANLSGQAWQPDNGNGTYTNPIIYADYSDPDVVRYGDNFYRVVVEDKNAPPIWARFYDLETSKPFFCDRDGIKRNTLADIGYERRNGYSWYTEHPAKVLKKYPEWKKKWDTK